MIGFGEMVTASIAWNGDNYGGELARTVGDADTIDAGEGDDWVDGGAGDDTINAGEGTNEIYGGLGSDAIIGGSGEDTIWGGNGSSDPGVDASDTISAGGGDDHCQRRRR